MAIIGRLVWNGHIRYAEIENETAYSIHDPFEKDGIVRSGDIAPLNALQVLVPVAPSKILAIGLNYVEHAKESGKDLPSEPLMWLKAPSSMVGPDEPVEIAYPSHRTDYEAELAVIIGRTCKHASEENALSYVLGFTNGQDISDRDIQRSESQWARAKSLDSYTPLGPFIHTDLDPQNVRVQTLVNGEVRQDGHTSDMIFSVAKIIAFISHAITLGAGDVILTGTPAGIGPLKHGDEIETRIGDMMPLKNPVRNRFDENHDGSRPA